MLLTALTCAFCTLCHFNENTARPQSPASLVYRLVISCNQFPIDEMASVTVTINSRPKQTSNLVHSSSRAGVIVGPLNKETTNDL